MATETLETEIDLTPDKGGTTQDVNDKSSSGGDDFDIEIVDDTPERDRNRQPRTPGTKSAIPEDDEIGQYTKGVQDRLKQMKWEYHEERRAKEAWQREHQAAVDFAKRLFEDNKKLRETMTKGHKALTDSTKGSIENEISALKESLKAALDTGDTVKAADLQAKIASAAARAEAQNHVAPITFEEAEFPRQFDGQQVQRQPQVRVTRKMQDWMDDNPWFNQNKRMTAYSFGVHEELLDNGVQPESPKYFSDLDKAMRGAFPEYFDTGEGNTRNGNTNGTARPRGTNVAGVNRTSSVRSKTTVSLTQSEKAVAKRLGLTEKQYAQEKLRLENLDG